MGALIYCPFPDRPSAREASATLLDEGLVACSNILGPIESHFLWEDRLETAEEVGVIFKTQEPSLKDAIERLGELHPYDIPAIIGWNCDVVHPSTAMWLGSLNKSG